MEMLKFRRVLQYETVLEYRVEVPNKAGVLGPPPYPSTDLGNTAMVSFSNLVRFTSRDHRMAG